VPVADIPASVTHQGRIYHQLRDFFLEVQETDPLISLL
jgi:hypothetical protein